MPGRPLKHILKNSSLTIVLFLMFLFSLAGQIGTGMATLNEELRLNDLPQISSVLDYISTSHFKSSLFENWESEFLQMALFVYLTACLVQIGSSESRPPKEERKKAPSQPERYFRKQPLFRRLYENSLSLALALIFVLTFALHAASHRQGVSILTDPEFWFESFQNWQSEFFSVALLGLLSIFLRQKDSPQSKPVDAPHWKTGSD